MQKDVKIDLEFINDANHIFNEHHFDLLKVIKSYLDHICC